MNKEQLKINLDKILNEVSKSKQSDAELIAVTKYVDIKVMEALYELGVRHFGENRAHEFLKKKEYFADKPDIQWHFIGRLQRRPVKDIINHIDYFHALDRISLAKEINKRAERIIPCFLQINISEESQKAGFGVNEVQAVVEELAEYEKICIIGLMTMAPYDISEKELHEIFVTLKELQSKVQALGLPHAPCKKVSMGMSQDYQIALEEGSNYIRVGQAIYEDVLIEEE